MDVSEYIRSLHANEDEHLKRIKQAVYEAEMPEISIPPETGQALKLLIRMTNRKRVLEIGCLGGYSSLWMARGLAEDGVVVSLEKEKKHVEVAKKELEQTPDGQKISIRHGDALEALQTMSEENERFDFFFIDADKERYEAYLDACIEIAQPGAIIAADNVLWKNRVIDPDVQDDLTIDVRSFNETVAADDRVDSLILPIGDGLTVALVR
ncbi:putative O-methyltransferase YrrM [Salsuginibacillus halophilus]|uniref:Putative O-methyltransferase YrrM n=1 Tax=Salsuginibacillus halophilus TaxID=517424 RepID=A0A2P8HBR0_9BACI|nr:class I SAM-dependent methyltransferase [Salsuginibacillus halophilus]PSL43571.1 putative O-methyltransferase YrrM [Salsuginibacillus halophilus]